MRCGRLLFAARGDRTAVRVGQVGLITADAAAAELGVSPRLIYVLVGRWRQCSGVVSDLVPGRSSGGRGREHLPDEVEGVVRELIRTHFLTRQKRTQAALYREVLRVCRINGLPAPSRGSIVRRIGKMDPGIVVNRREGSDAARNLTAAGGLVPQVSGLLIRCRLITRRWI